MSQNDGPERFRRWLTMSLILPARRIGELLRLTDRETEHIPRLMVVGA